MVILEFLQSVLDNGRAGASLKRYFSGISACNIGHNGIPIDQIPLVAKGPNR